MLQHLHSASAEPIRSLSGDEIDSVNGGVGGVKYIYVKVVRADGSYYFYPVLVSDDYPAPTSIA